MTASITTSRGALVRFFGALAVSTLTGLVPLTADAAPPIARAPAAARLDRPAALSLTRSYFPRLSPSPIATARIGSPSTLGLTSPLAVTPARSATGALVVRTRGLAFRIRRVGARWPTRRAPGVRFDTPTHLLSPAGRFASIATGWLTERIDEYRVLDPGPAYAATYEAILPRAVTRIHDAGRYLELCRANGVPVLRFHAAVARGADGTTRRGDLEVSGLPRGGWRTVSGRLRIRTTVRTTGLAGPVVVDPGWSSTGSMSEARAKFSQVLLLTGKVLVVGGDGTAELYDPQTETWAATGSMATPRFGGVVVRLASGKVLVTSGSLVTSTEIYDPATGTWSAAADFPGSRAEASGVLLRSGKVLIAGGEDGPGNMLTQSWLYDPVADHFFATTGVLNVGRLNPSATLLRSGKVLLGMGCGTSATGCFTGGVSGYAAPEVYDPVTETWTQTTGYIGLRQDASAVLLPSGNVLVAGGYHWAWYPYNGGYWYQYTLGTAEVYSPWSNSWAAAASLETPRQWGSMVWLPSGKAMILGGKLNGALDDAEVYDPTLGTWANAGKLTVGRYAAQATVLPSGKVLLTGGMEWSSTYGFTGTATADLYDPETPSAADQSVSLLADATVAITLTGTDADGDALAYTVVDAPSHGALTGTAPNLVYTPDAGYRGDDAFTFTASDAASTSAPATVSITVTDNPPVAPDQSVTGPANQDIQVTLTATDDEGDALTYSVASEPAHGTLAGTAPDLTYTPDADYHGPDAFTFTANDGTFDSNVATVTIAVGDTAPVADDQQVTTDADQPAPVTLTATDPEGDPLTYRVATQPSHGTLAGTPPALSYVPATGFHGTDAFTFVASDGILDSNVATVDIGVSDLPPVADDATVYALAGKPAPVTLRASDPDGDVLSYQVTKKPSHGTIEGTPPELVYTAAASFTGKDALTFSVSDGSSSASGTLTLEVAANPNAAKPKTGCSCDATTGSPASAWGLVLCLALWAWRRRRSPATRRQGSR